MRLNSTVCPHHILMAMPLGANYAAYCIGKYQPKTLDELAKLCGRLKTIELLIYLSRNHYAEISRLRYGQTKSGFGIVIHYGTMNCGGTYSTHTFNPFENKNRITLPLNTGFAAFTNDHVMTVMEKVSSAVIGDDDYTDFCHKAMRQIVSNNPGRTINMSANSMANGAIALRLLVEKDGFPLEDVMDAICWSLHDPFWKDNVFSMAPMRSISKTNGLKKFENIQNSYLMNVGSSVRKREFGKVTTNKVSV